MSARPADDLSARLAALQADLEQLGLDLAALHARQLAVWREHLACLAALAARGPAAPRWARASAAARALGVDRSTVRRWGRRGRLRTLRWGQTVLYQIPDQFPEEVQDGEWGG